MFSLASRIALVTGAGSGIGASIAETFARAGAKVYVVDRDEKSAQSTAARICDSGGDAMALCGDVSVEADCGRLAAEALQREGRLDILVNNAGIGHVGTALQTTAADLDRLYAVNVRGVFNMSKAFLPSMLLRKHGVILNMASIGCNESSAPRRFDAGRFAPLAITAMRPFSTVNRSTIRLDSLYA